MSSEVGDLPHVEFGIEVFPQPARRSASPSPGAPWLAPSSGSINRAADRLAIIGDAAVEAAVSGLSGAILRVADGVVARFRDDTEGKAVTLDSLKTVELSFGLKLTAGSGKLVEAVVTAGSEATVQVKIVIEPRRGTSA